MWREGDAPAGEVEGGSQWQGAGSHEWSACVVLHCVLARAGARELWRCGAVCRAWRAAAADARLWRRIVQPHARPDTLAALHLLLSQSADESLEESADKSSSWWREQYVMSTARWRLRRRLAGADDGVALSCAALHEREPLLALLREDAHLTVWRGTGSAADGWVAHWSGPASAEWRGATDASWAPSAPRLLLAGPLALAHRIEVIVIDFAECTETQLGAVACRAVSAGGAAGCWVNDGAFLTLQLRLLAPHHAVTTLWLNSSSQETQSEHAGVTAPLLRVYNEAATTISHVMLVRLPPARPAAPVTAANAPQVDGEANAYYYQALTASKETDSTIAQQAVILAGSVAGGVRGEACALLLWCVVALAPPRLRVREELAERVRRRRERPRVEPPEPDEATVRALCTPPDAVCVLPARILGLALNPSGSCVWASTSAGAACVSLSELRTVLWLPARSAAATLHTVLPSADEHFFITPVGGGGARAITWLVRGGASGVQLAADAPVLATLLLPRTPHRLLLLTTTALEVQTSTRRTHERGAGGAEGVEECRPNPCCAPPPPRMFDVRITCKQPLTGCPPPCAPPAHPPSRTCADAMTKAKVAKEMKRFDDIEVADETCGVRLYEVTLRLAAAARVRRRDYEREAAVREPPPPSDFSTYCLAAETATNIPPICPTEDTTINCDISHNKHIDPCAHSPRTTIEIDRSGDTTKRQDACYEPSLQTAEPSKATEGLTTRIMEKFKRTKVSEENTSPPHGIRPKPVRLCPKPGGGCGQTTTKRGIHTIVASCAKEREGGEFLELPQSVHSVDLPQSLHFNIIFFLSNHLNIEALSPATSLCSRDRSYSWISFWNIRKKISSLWRKDEFLPKTSASPSNPYQRKPEGVRAHTPRDQTHAKRTDQSNNRRPPTVKCSSD